MGVRMSVVSGFGFGMLTLIFGHLAHHILARKRSARGGDAPHDGDASRQPAADRFVGWAAAGFFLVATLVLGYSGGLRAYTLANAAEAGATVTGFSILIGSVFGFMMPFGAVIGMSRGGFLWHLVVNLILGIPLLFGLILLLAAAFVYYLVDIVINLFTLPINGAFSVIAGFAGLRHDESVDPVGEATPVSGWRIGLLRLVSSVEPPPRLRAFLDHVRQQVTTFLEEDRRKR